MIGNLSSDYDTKCTMFGSHRTYETIYFLFHFKIVQYKKITVSDAVLRKNT
jgi:hypothetical protein